MFDSELPDEGKVRIAELDAGHSIGFDRTVRVVIGGLLDFIKSTLS